MITQTYKKVYDSVLALSHTGDVNWQIGLNVSGKGMGDFLCQGNVMGTWEVKFTIDGTVLYNGVIGRGNNSVGVFTTMKWEKSILFEYRVNNAAWTVYINAMYYNN